MTTRVHTITADMLREEDRILLKDLRVLTVTGALEQKDGWIIRYRELATDTRGSLATITGQQVKILCEGRCSIDLAVADLI